MKRNESKQTSRNGQYANVCLSSVVFFSWWIYQSQNGIRYFQFWSCVTVARTWLLFRLFFLSFTLQQWALKLCVCVCGFIRDSSSFFLVTFSIITAFSCHLDMCHFTGVCVVDCFYVGELKISLFYTLFHYDWRLVKIKSISIFKIDFKQNVCSLMRNHSSLDCQLVYDYNTAVDLFCICSIHQWAECIGTSSTLYVRGTV